MQENFIIIVIYLIQVTLKPCQHYLKVKVTKTLNCYYLSQFFWQNLYFCSNLKHIAIITFSNSVFDYYLHINLYFYFFQRFINQKQTIVLILIIFYHYVNALNFVFLRKLIMICCPFTQLTNFLLFFSFPLLFAIFFSF